MVFLATMDTPSGSFYRGGYSLTPTLPPARASPSTPSAAGHHTHTANMNQKLDLMLSMFMEQKKTAEETKVSTDELKNQVIALSSEMLEMKSKVILQEVVPEKKEDSTRSSFCKTTSRLFRVAVPWKRACFYINTRYSSHLLFSAPCL